MRFKVSERLNKRYPQNYIIKNPLCGSLVFLGFCLFFFIIYKPLQIHESRFFGIDITVATYCLIMAIPLFLLIRVLKRVKCFSNADEWTIFKELLFIVLLLLGIGIIVYFSGFLLEPPSQRWNLPTFFDSVFSAFLIFSVPLGFFSIINYRYLLVSDIIKHFNTDSGLSSPEPAEQVIRIGSQLKKEELTFLPSQFLYAESDGNYIVFHLNIENQIKKKIIRNSISNVEQQLSAIPFFFRTHRAYIVNLKSVCSQKGNSLGYRLKLSGTDSEIPVSRQKTHDFDITLGRYH
jgi:hypothetical protein